MTIQEILKARNAEEYRFNAYREKGLNVPDALARAQEDSLAIAKHTENPKIYPWPKLPRTITYNPVASSGFRWIENVSCGLRLVGKAHDIIRLDHTGWYINSFYETCYGIVYQLPARNGKTQFVPAVSDPWNADCALVDFSQIEDEKESAASRADSMAESYAEECRENDAKAQAEGETECLQAEIKEERKTILSLCLELKAARRVLRDCEAFKTLNTAIREKISNSLSDIRKHRERIEALANNYWLAVENY